MTYIEEDTKLTGARRYRIEKSFFGKEKLILQVEVSGLHCFSAGPSIEHEKVTYWRDATFADTQDPKFGS